MKISQGKLKRDQQPYDVYRLNMTHLDTILKLQKEVYEHLEDQTKLQPLTKDEFEYILKGQGLVIGAYVRDQLIAVRSLLIPKIDDEHLGFLAGLKEEELDEVIYQEISFVHPQFQGNGLQQILAKLIMEDLNRKDHPFTYVCATVAPDNIPSLLDKFRQNLRLVKLITIYGGKQRYIFMKRINEEDPPVDDASSIDIEYTDRFTIKKKLSEGFIGVNMRRVKDSFYMTFKEIKAY